IVTAAHEIGLNRISFMAVDVSSTAFNRPEPWQEPRVAEVAHDRAETEEFTALVEDTIQRCAADCDSRSISEKPQKLRRLPRYYAIAAEYDEHVRGDDWMRQVLHAHYLRLFRSGDRVLDAGCGTGIDAIVLARAGVHVVGIDGAPAVIERMRAKVLNAGVADLV